MVDLGPIQYSVNGGSEIAILKQHRNHNWERVIAALAYARDRLPTYTVAERDTLSEILIEMKDYYVGSYIGGFQEGNPGPVASRLYFHMTASENK